MAITPVYAEAGNMMFVAERDGLHPTDQRPIAEIGVTANKRYQEAVNIAAAKRMARSRVSASAVKIWANIIPRTRK